MKYWILKANQRYNDPLEDWVYRGNSTRWGSAWLPINFGPGDRVIIWQSGSVKKVKALGHVEKFSKTDNDGRKRFYVGYLTDYFDSSLDLSALRKIKLFKGAAFLKSGPAYTIFSLSERQGRFLWESFLSEVESTTRISLEVVQKQLAKKIEIAQGISAKALRLRLAKAPKKPAKRTVTVQIFDRNPDVIVEVLRRAVGMCAACKKKAPFIRVKNGTPYLEVHHKIPLADGGDDSVANAVALCPNCHRNEHHGRPLYGARKSQLVERMTWQDQDIEFDP